jgi:hypothetical protein
LSFETRQLLLRYSYNSKNYDLPKHTIENIKTEEECALVGLMYECLILSIWTNKFPDIKFEDINHHNLFADFISKIKNLIHKYNHFKKQNHTIYNEKIRFTGSFLYAQLYLFITQKIWIQNISAQSLFDHWIKIKPHIDLITLNNIKSQVNIKMPFLTGIMDAVAINNEFNIIEIKASRSTEWKNNALLQSIIYGIMNGKTKFNIYLINVFSKQIKFYTIYLKQDLIWLRNRLIQDIINWNLNCYFAKNINFQKNHLNNISISKSLFVDGYFDSQKQEWTEFTICEFQSLTKIKLHILTKHPSNESNSSLEQEFLESIEKYKSVYQIQYIYCFQPFMKEFIYIKNILKMHTSNTYSNIAFGLCHLLDSNDYNFIYP